MTTQEKTDRRIRNLEGQLAKATTKAEVELIEQKIKVLRKQ